MSYVKLSLCPTVIVFAQKGPKMLRSIVLLLIGKTIQIREYQGCEIRYFLFVLNFTSTALKELFSFGTVFSVAFVNLSSNLGGYINSLCWLL